MTVAMAGRDVILVDVLLLTLVVCVAHGFNAGNDITGTMHGVVYCAKKCH